MCIENPKLEALLRATQGSVEILRSRVRILERVIFQVRRELDELQEVRNTLEESLHKDNISKDSQEQMNRLVASLNKALTHLELGRGFPRH